MVADLRRSPLHCRMTFCSPSTKPTVEPHVECVCRINEQSGWQMLLVIILVNKKPPKGPSATSLENLPTVFPGVMTFPGAPLHFCIPIRRRHQTHHYFTFYKDSFKNATNYSWNMHPIFRDAKNMKKIYIIELRNVMLPCLPLSLKPSSRARCNSVSQH